MTAPGEFQDTIKSPSWSQAGSSNHMPKRSAEIVAQKGKYLDMKSGTQTGAEDQYPQYGTRVPNGCKRPSPRYRTWVPNRHRRPTLTI
ncbi:hypothetical protein RCL_jg13732.t1 [Rhizophagus clarus]|uniref:Uncharacterized protein n=1 Tax=Rhizophagus clarus TaxID=94130 RepID=A0A8H3MGX5_9GLOM|nr:hypothetical protein RCL_jg13732.t1 [Rhizophagus clarus]